MKSRFFTDTQALDASVPEDGRIHICLRLSPEAVDALLTGAETLGVGTGAYLERLLLSAGTKEPLPPYSPRPCLPPAPPGH